MKLIMAISLASLMMVFGVWPAYAKDCKGVSFPAQAQVEGKPLVLNGLGLRQATVLKVNVYVAALYVNSASGDPQTILQSATPKQLILHFLRDVDGGDLNEAWDEGFANNAREQLPTLKDQIEKLKGWMTDMKTGRRPLAPRHCLHSGNRIVIESSATVT